MDDKTPKPATAPKSIEQKKLHYYRGLLICAAVMIMFFVASWFFPNIRETIKYYVGYLSAVVYGVFIAYIMSPAVEFFRPKIEKRLLKSKHERVRRKASKTAKGCSIAIAMVIFIVVLAALLLIIIPTVLSSVIDLGKKAPDLINKVADKLQEWNTDRSWAGSFQNYIDTLLDAVTKWITNTLVPKATTALTGLTSAAWKVCLFLFNILIGIVIAVYALMEKYTMVAWCKKITYAVFKPDTANLVIDTARHGNKIFQGFLSGSLIDCLMVGIICFIFNLIAGIPYPLLIAVIVGITNIIPFFGPFIGAIPSGFLILLISPFKCFVFVIFMVVLNQIEGHIIVPQILGRATGVSEFWVTFALLFFGAMFGVSGMIFGVPILAVISYVISNLVDKRLTKDKKITDTDYYYQIDKYDEATGEYTMLDGDAARRERLEEAKRRSERSRAFFRRIGNIFRKKKNRK